MVVVQAIYVFLRFYEGSNQVNQMFDISVQVFFLPTADNDKNIDV